MGCIVSRSVGLIRNVPLLAAHFLLHGPAKTRAKRLSAEAGDLLKKGRWTRNLIQLESTVLAVADAYAEGDTIEADDVLKYFRSQPR